MRSTVARFAAQLLPVVAATALVTLLVPGRLQGASVWLVTFTIDDAAGIMTVRSDGNGPYVDYRTLPAPPNPCVADVSAGLVFAVLNRKIDSAGTRCSQTYTARQYELDLTGAPQACEKLWNAYGANGVVEWNGGDSCKLKETRNPRIRVTDLFKGGKTTSTPLAFLADNSTPLNYEIRALANVPITAPSANRRELTCVGCSFQLVEFGGRSQYVAEAFPLTLHMVFDRYTQ